MSLRGLLPLFATAAVTAAAAVPAGAAPPQRVPSTPQTTDFEAGLFCSFAIRVTETTNKQTIKIFSSGSALATGAYKVTITNLDNGRSISLNASGPGRLDTETAYGRSLFFLASPEEAFGQGVFVTTGRQQIVRNAEGLIVAVNGGGTRSGNLCDAIA